MASRAASALAESSTLYAKVEVFENLT